MTNSTQAIAFIGPRAVASGLLCDVVVAAKRSVENREVAPLLIFDWVSGQPIDIDFSGTADDVRARFAAPVAEEAERGRGRPKLGVVPREVTLLPRHWDWLAAQRGGASAALRRLVDEARRATETADAARRGKEALYRFATAMAGDAPGYEEATRALFADDEARFEAMIESWPIDIRNHALTMASAAFGHAPSPLDDVIPGAKRSAVRRALAEAFPGAAVEAAERMTWGASGAGVFKLMVAGKPCVLRIEGPPNGFRDPVRQYACTRIAAEAGVAPPLLYAEAKAGISLSAFVDTASANPTLFNAEHLKAVVQVVRRLHDAPLFPERMAYLDALDGLIGQFKGSGIASPDALASPLSLYTRLTVDYPRHDPDLVSSHNDLNPSNIMFDGERPFIIDWEAASAGDRYADIAALANWFGADTATEDLILNTYFDGPPGKERRARFATMRQINRLFFGVILIGSVQAERPQTRLSAEDFTRERFTDIRSEMRMLGTWEGRLRFGCAFIGEALQNDADARSAH